ncbi:hypothetical protein CYLTODRAFT_421316 [Cylindrobasidium torrendii FP15055 ss-10]|uniref:Lipoyl-binding domain-containing protein n=1 Tax=Cylindrobasidium torrendii FP15055 ss-10 TaxID=1314674 RepID=A0A0D7BGG8_9AGAR|nr:hypothetical protein CYLTODRAFT_421316 [Cylindrobasidium torrendii FP15055 ss-10]
MLNIARRPSVSQTMQRAHTRAFSESRTRPAILMPAMSPFLKTANVCHWRKKEGESFVAGESLVQIESDIATIDIVAESPGIIGQILIPDGTHDVPVEKIIATVARDQAELAIMMRSRLPPQPPTPRSASPAPSLRGLAPRTGSPAPASHQPLLSAVSAASARPPSIHAARTMSTGSVPSSPSVSRFTKGSDCHQDSGAMLRRKIVTNMASSGRGQKGDYFDGIL